MKDMNGSEWVECNSKIFWGKISTRDHLVQIYENDTVVLDSLEGFVCSGFKAGESVIIIATTEHLKALEERLRINGFDINALCSTDQYIPLNAEETLSKFMINGWPNKDLFMESVKEVVTRARGKKRRPVRAYGEMVAILWAQGHSGATIRLENLWNKFSETEAFCLFCAYPKISFTQDINTSISNICATHTKVISGEVGPATEIFYKGSQQKIPIFRPLLT